MSVNKNIIQFASSLTSTGSISAASNVLPAATTSTLGAVKVDGTTITINNGVISGANTYTLPTASNTTLGGVKVDGTTITITDGVISGANTYTLPAATTSTLGGVKVDGTTITISNGVISGANTYTLPTATSSTLGGVKVDGTSITISNGVISSVGGGGSSSAYNRTSFLADEGQTVFNVIYTVGFINVYINGTLLDTASYTATNGTSITLGIGCKFDDIVDVFAFSNVNLTALPTATTSTLGAIKVDGNTIKVTDGIISTDSTAYNRNSFTATAGQTVFSVIYTVNYVNVYINGTLLDTASYTATDGTSITLSTACTAGDLVDIFAFSNVVLRGVPTATTSTIGGVKVDGTTIQINNGVISSVSGAFNIITEGLLFAFTGTVRWYAPNNISISSVTARLVVAADQPIIIVIKINGSAVATINIPTGQLSNTYSTPISINTGDYLTTDITQVGTTAPGQDLYLQFKYR